MPTAEELAKKLQEQDAGNVPKRRNIQTVLEEQSSQFKKYLSNDVLVERFIRTVLTLCKINPKLGDCTFESILAGCMQGVALRLDFTPQLRQAYLVPYKLWDKETRKQVLTAQFQIGYKGFVELFSRSQYFKHIYSEVVFEKDYIKISKGTNPMIEHNINTDIQDRGKIKGYYAIATLSNGMQYFDYWTRERMLKHAKQHSQAYRADLLSLKEKEIIIEPDGTIVKGERICSPWTKNEDEMGRKTMIKVVLKDVPMPSDDQAEEELRIKKALIADETIRNYQLDANSAADVFSLKDSRYDADNKPTDLFDEDVPSESANLVDIDPPAEEQEQPKETKTTEAEQPEQSQEAQPQTTTDTGGNENEEEDWN